MKRLLLLAPLAALFVACNVAPTPTPAPTATCACPTCAPTATTRPTRTPTPEPATATPAPTWDGSGFKRNAAPELIGICQGDGSHGAGGNNWYYVSGQSLAWRFIEPMAGTYNFSAPDPGGYLGQAPIPAVATVTALDAKNQAAGREPFYLWLQLAWWSPGNDWIPAWAQIERLPYVGNPGDGTFPNPFDARIVTAMRPAIAEMARRWNSEPRVSAFLAYLGEYGEMNVKYVCAKDTPGTKSDCGSEPDNVLIQAAIKRVKAETGETVTPAQMIASYPDASGVAWQHRWQRELFIYFVKPMIEMYAAAWTKTPIVIQLGNMSEWHFGNAHCGANEAGVTCASLAEKVAEYASTWDGRVWLKQNGLGNSSTGAYAVLMGKYSNRTRVIWEPGSTTPDGDKLNAAINVGKASATCYQSWLIDGGMSIPLTTQKAMLRDNYMATYWSKP